MGKHWWKITGTILLFIVFTLGLLVPLRPGINKVVPGNVEAGESVVLQLYGYNTEFDKQTPPRAYLWLDNEHIIQATQVEVLGSTRVDAKFEVPNFVKDLTARELKVSTYDSENGFITALQRLQLQSALADADLARKLWGAEVTHPETKGGFNFPYLPNIYESVRNTFYHVALWFAMFFLFVLGVVSSIRYIRTNQSAHDWRAVGYTSAGVLFGILGLVTGAIWANYTWNKAWSWDIKQTMTAIVLLIYGAYFVLRLSFDDADKRARIGAVYNIFAFASIIPLLYVIPRLTESLHPGGQGNPAFGRDDLDMNVRIVFYAAILGWSMLGLWIANLVSRIKRLEEKWEETGWN